PETTMFHSSRWVVVALAMAGGLAADRPIADKAPPRSRGVEVRFADGSSVRMVLLQLSLEVETKYGKLIVPTADLRRVEFGVQLPDDVRKQVEGAVRKLGSATAAEREAASKELVALGASAYPALHAAAESADLEAARRGGEAM